MGIGELGIIGGAAVVECAGAAGECGLLDVACLLEDAGLEEVARKTTPTPATSTTANIATRSGAGALFLFGGGALSPGVAGAAAHAGPEAGTAGGCH
jgi:hypothetical protein